MKYDDISWHLGSGFPRELSYVRAGTHTGMFLAWAATDYLVSEAHEEHSRSELVRVRGRRMTGRQFLEWACDRKFTDQDLNEEGNRFARHYYWCDGEYGQYMKDYEEALASGLPSLYHVRN